MQVIITKDATLQQALLFWPCTIFTLYDFYCNLSNTSYLFFILFQQQFDSYMKIERVSKMVNHGSLVTIKSVKKKKKKF